MKILITGSNGLLGQKLVTLISSKAEHELIATSRGGNRIPSGNYLYDPIDITNQHEVHTIITKHKPDVIIHAAAMTQVDECELNQAQCWQTNVTATDYLIEAGNAVDAHFVYVSTDFVFDGSEGPLDEQAIPNPVNYYGESKLAAEQLVQTKCTSWSIVRTVLVFGVAHDPSRSNIVLWVKKSLENKNPIKVVNDQWRTPTLAEDLALGCLLVAEKKAPGIFHISGNEMVTPYELALKVADHFQLDASLISKVDASTFSQPGKRPPKTGFIIEKAQKELRFKPTSLLESLEIIRTQLK